MLILKDLNLENKEKSKVTKRKLPCPTCTSSDAFHIYSDNHGYCFSCNTLIKDVKDYDIPMVENKTYENTPKNFTYSYVDLRGVTSKTMEFFNCLTKIDSETGKPVNIGFPYGSAYKVRRLDKKDFYSMGEMSNATLFGKELFPPASHKFITITEGELDAMSVYQMLGSRYPVVSVRSASSAKEDCRRERDYINSFAKIILCFDNDEPGQKAALEVSKLFDFNKVFIVKMDKELKDPNEYLTSGKEAAFVAAWWNCKKFVPDNILSNISEFEELIENEEQTASAKYPWKTLQEQTKGIRKREIVLLTAMEGIGKTEILRSIEYNILRTTKSNIGIIHLEEGKKRVIQGLGGYHLNTPVHLEESQVSKEEVKKAIKDLVQEDGRLFIYSHFGSDDPSIILDTIRYLVSTCGCEYIFFDHITMAISGLDTQDERRALDMISTRLAMMVEELNFSLFLVSHINDDGLTRGSRNISKIANIWIQLDRNPLAENPEERNSTRLTIRKNRFSGLTGPSSFLSFDPSTFVTKEKSDSFNLPPTHENT